MAWTSKIIDKSLEGGKVTVMVEYTNGITRFNEIYESKGVPEAKWIEHLVYNRIQSLENQTLTDIPTGVITPINPTTITPVSTGQTDWNNRFRKLQTIDLLLKYNIVSTTDADIITLRNYLANNWKTFIKE